MNLILALEILPSLTSVGSEFMMNLRSWKKTWLVSTNCGSRTVKFIKMLQMDVIAYLELTISNLELSIMNKGSDTFTVPATA
jgi:hypothetical protein